eukprot:1890733-Pyramimonas_sp.AAC.1
MIAAVTARLLQKCLELLKPRKVRVRELIWPFWDQGRRPPLTYGANVSHRTDHDRLTPIASH